jgi:hypothetical protein
LKCLLGFVTGFILLCSIISMFYLCYKKYSKSCFLDNCQNFGLFRASNFDTNKKTMKRTLLFVLPLLTCFVYFACRKDQSQAINIKPQDPFVTSAAEYLKSSLNNAELAQLNFDDINLISDGNKTFVAKIFKKNNSHNRFVFLSKDKKSIVVIG